MLNSSNGSSKMQLNIRVVMQFKDITHFNRETGNFAHTFVAREQNLDSDKRGNTQKLISIIFQDYNADKEAASLRRERMQVLGDKVDEYEEQYDRMSKKHNIPDIIERSKKSPQSLSGAEKLIISLLKPEEYEANLKELEKLSKFDVNRRIDLIELNKEKMVKDIGSQVLSIIKDNPDREIVVKFFILGHGNVDMEEITNENPDERAAVNLYKVMDIINKATEEIKDKTQETNRFHVIMGPCYIASKDRETRISPEYKNRINVEDIKNTEYSETTFGKLIEIASPSIEKFKGNDGPSYGKIQGTDIGSKDNSNIVIAKRNSSPKKAENNTPSI